MTEGYIQLSLDKPFLVVTKSGHLYNEMSEVEFLACLADGIRKCPTLMSMHNVIDTTCLMDIYLGDMDMAMTKCNYRVFSGNVPCIYPTPLCNFNRCG